MKIFNANYTATFRFCYTKGTNYDGAWDSWYGPAANEDPYNVSKVLKSPAGIAMRAAKSMASVKEMERLRKDSLVNCGAVKEIDCKPLQAPCLFDISEDPCERRNLADA